MKDMDLTFLDSNNMLNIRVAGIIIKDNKVLMVKNLRSDYIYSLGGRLKFGENSRDAVVREVWEETGVLMEVDRLGFVYENFFTGHTPSKMDKTVYEITFFYYMKVPENFQIKNDIPTTEENPETLVWLDWHSDEEYYPLFYRTELDNPSHDVKHIFIDERLF